jgi:hypothetical protein
VLVQTGGTLDSRSYAANNSPQLVQGDQNAGVSQSLDQSVYVADSFNERAQQVAGLDELIALLSTDSSVMPAVINLSKARDEVAEESSPDPKRIWKWLERAKLSLETAKLSKDAIEATKGVFSSFEALALLSQMPW